MKSATVTHGSPEWHAVVELRREVLRLPLGLDFTPEELQAEREQVVLGLYDDHLVACALLVFGDDPTVKVRQVAVEPKVQGKGYGRATMEATERHAAERGASEIVLHARDTAVPFYLRLNYSLEGEPFEEVGLPHRRMRKRL